MLKVTLVRHAEPAYFSDGRAWNNPPLTDRGQAQAHAVATAAETWDVADAIWVSPLRRVLETAGPTLDILGHEPITHDWLEEVGLPGAWDGAPLEEAEQAMNASRSRPLLDWWDGIPGGEPFSDFHDRVTRGALAALAEHDVAPIGDVPGAWSLPERDLHLVVFAHTGTNSMLMCLLLGLTPVPWEFERFPMPMATITEIRSRPLGDASVLSLSRFSAAEHLQ